MFIKNIKKKSQLIYNIILYHTVRLTYEQILLMWHIFSFVVGVLCYCKKKNRPTIVFLLNKKKLLYCRISRFSGVFPRFTRYLEGLETLDGADSTKIAVQNS